MLLNRKVLFPVLCCFLLLVSKASIAGPGEGIRAGNLIINPFVEGSFTWDSNIRLTETNQTEDSFADYLGGVQFRYQRPSFSFEGRAFLLFRRYTLLDDENFDNWGEQAGFYAGRRDKLSVYITQRHRIIDDYDRTSYFGQAAGAEEQNLSLTYDCSTRVRRTLSDAGIIFGKNAGSKTELDFGGNYSDERYETNALSRIRRIDFKGEAAYRVAGKTSVFLFINSGLEQNESIDDDGSSYAARVGLKKKSTDKLSFRAGAGVEAYQRPETVVMSTNDVKPSSETVLSLEASATWQATQKVRVEFAGNNTVQSVPQYVDMLDMATMASLNIVYSVTTRFSLSLTGSFRRDDYLDPVVIEGETWDRLDEHRAGMIRVDYVPPRKFLTAYIEGSYEESTSTVPSYNYDQQRLAVGLSLRY